MNKLYDQELIRSMFHVYTLLVSAGYKSHIEITNVQNNLTEMGMSDTSYNPDTDKAWCRATLSSYHTMPETEENPRQINVTIEADSDVSENENQERVVDLYKNHHALRNDFVEESILFQECRDLSFPLALLLDNGSKAQEEAMEEIRSFMPCVISTEEDKVKAATRFLSTLAAANFYKNANVDEEVLSKSSYSSKFWENEDSQSTLIFRQAIAFITMLAYEDVTFSDVKVDFGFTETGFVNSIKMELEQRLSGRRLVYEFNDVDGLTVYGIYLDGTEEDLFALTEIPDPLMFRVHIKGVTQLLYGA